MGEAKDIEIRAAMAEGAEDDRPEDYPWPSEQELRDDEEDDFRSYLERGDAWDANF